MRITFAFCQTCESDRLLGKAIIGDFQNQNHSASNEGFMCIKEGLNPKNINELI